MAFTLSTYANSSHVTIDIPTTQTFVEAISETVVEEPVEVIPTIEVEEPIVVEIVSEPEPVIEEVIVSEPILEPEPEPMEPELPLTDEEIYLVALVTVAEAEGESVEGKRLVIDTILNRANSDHSYWPDNVTDVIYQPHQFTSMWNGRVDRSVVTDDVIQLVEEELISQTNYDVVYFRTSHYSNYGTPMFQVGNHYFSSL
jgi:N-acetylmuramoyl-L-alanine amidase